MPKGTSQSMKTMAQEWAEYRGSCYGKLSRVQEKELRQAFYAGALVAITGMMNAADLPEGEAIKSMQVRAQEIVAFMRPVNG